MKVRSVFFLCTFKESSKNPISPKSTEHIISVKKIPFCSTGIPNGNIAVAIFDIIVIGAYIIFLLFNWHKAKVFMGDTGSFFLGAVIALSAIATGLEFVLPLIAIIPVVETVSVILQVMYYKKTKKRLFKMAPLHHHFEQSGWKEVKVVRIFTLITILMCLITKFVLNI